MSAKVSQPNDAVIVPPELTAHMCSLRIQREGRWLAAYWHWRRDAARSYTRRVQGRDAAQLVERIKQRVETRREWGHLAEPPNERECTTCGTTAEVRR